MQQQQQQLTTNNNNNHNKSKKKKKNNNNNSHSNPCCGSAIALAVSAHGANAGVEGVLTAIPPSFLARNRALEPGSWAPSKCAN